MRILWHSNAPWAPSGYGQQTALFAPRIRDQGHDVACLAFWGLAGSPLEWEGLPVYPGGMNPWGNDVLAAFGLHWLMGNISAGWIITLMDVWTLTSDRLRDVRVASWVPIDHKPMPPAVAGFFVRTGAVPIAMSRFGVEQLEYQEMESLYVPHGVDTNVFAPREDKATTREQMGIPEDAFVVGMVAANNGTSPARKAFPEVMQAFARFRQKRPSAKLFMHTKEKPPQGLDLRYLAENFGIEDDIIWIDQAAMWLGDIAPPVMAQIYGTFDVLVNPSYGEGFGIPIMEAQACGVPVIVADNSAMPELLGGGWLVPCEPFWDEHQKSFYGRPIVSEIEAALEKAYHASAKVGRDARAKALEYDADHIAETYWRPVLADLEARLEMEVDSEPVDLDAVREALRHEPEDEIVEEVVKG